MNFKAESDESGQLFIVRVGDGTQVPVDGSDDAFCDVLSRSSPSREQFFNDKAKLVEECKAFGVMLYTTTRYLRTSPQFDSRQVPRTFQGVTFHFNQLSRCMPAPANVLASEIAGVVGTPAMILVSDSLLQTLNDELQNADSEVRRVSSLPVERSFVYVDVSDFSKYKPAQQALVINLIGMITRHLDSWQNAKAAQSKDDLETSLCIGDGYIFVFRHAWYATFFAAYLAYLLDVYNARGLTTLDVHFRASVHTGEVLSFWDFHRQGWNYIGAGITGGQRVLSVVGKDQDDVVFVSSQTRRKILACRSKLPRYLMDIPNHLQNRGRRKDKHDVYWRVYEVDHTRVTEHHRAAWLEAINDVLFTSEALPPSDGK
jgi:hypothetical protein